MKQVVAMMALVVASLLSSPTVYSEEKATGVSGEYKNFESTGKKDQCLIVAKNCSGASDDVLKRVERLNKEIGKGTSVYTPEELKNFQEQLNWIYYESGEFPAVRM